MKVLSIIKLLCYFGQAGARLAFYPRLIVHVIANQYGIVLGFI